MSTQTSSFLCHRLLPKMGAPTHLVVLFHGYGASGSDLLPLASFFAVHFPQAVFTVLEAAEACLFVPGGRQWFPLEWELLNQFQIAPTEAHLSALEGSLAEGLRYVTPSLEKFLSEELEKWSLEPFQMSFMGFSQGAMVALHLGLTSCLAPRALVSFSGLFVEKAAPIIHRPVVLLTHGDEDQIVSPTALQVSSARLRAHEIPVTSYLSPGTAHGIDSVMCEKARDFLRLMMEESSSLLHQPHSGAMPKAWR